MTTNQFTWASPLMNTISHYMALIKWIWNVLKIVSPGSFWHTCQAAVVYKWVSVTSPQINGVVDVLKFPDIWRNVAVNQFLPGPLCIVCINRGLSQWQGQWVTIRLS